ncbi:transcriptional regulator family: bZIP [Penicillium roqueforti]|uniref:Basic-leucine zipper domain n=1 Tax=Penicillium roqueforti (strain FM164) TaxID=1365484 RepID=W6QD60_PENRF|nr:transcriptional regulator family: bZIP [Penicillium roqueforti]CDM34001.1 Basic-leucine zipper domain [Penicillium roqueforti FM164]KAF9251259.1 transcriptional regulator family: bZIP [Penicillium roqueforti]KAI1837881.1 transcriptional regulator family: bZIP [Penicillium roqueforti]KAI2678571.1 transcriptional regulator family: bZIP [Penicillium roqueforti]KAI2689374.1 transcriptional regulator family: bZIP [Penicillium roqueforti]
MDYSFYDPRSQPSGFSLYGLPTPDQPHAQPDTFAPVNNYQNFPGYIPPFPADPSFVPPPHSPPDSVKHSASSDAANTQHTRPTSFDGDETQFADPALGRSSSEEKDSAPAQSKRKAQNRAAQRAFRERKEQHVRDLEDKVNSLEQASNTLQADNERLKRELARYTTENEILRATSQQANRGHVGANENPEPTVTGPMKYSPTDFHTTFMADSPGTSRNLHHRLTVCPITGEKLLDAGATWDLIQKHELFERGQLDIGDVTERLKGMSQCDGQGPAFKESQVRRAIEESAAAGRDELI